MPIYQADLHIHTVLSPCAEVEMIPPLIVAKALEVGLDIIGITDHNSAENVESVTRAAEGTALRVLPGMECESVEGIHIVCLFDTIEETMAMQETISKALPNLPNRPETFGPQFVVDAEGEFVRYNERLLLAPCSLTVDDIADRVEELHGLCYPAHVDRPSYGIYGVLGFLPPTPIFPILELSHHTSPDKARIDYPDIGNRILIQSSDAHRLDEVGSARCLLELEHRRIASIKSLIENQSCREANAPGNLHFQGNR
jgi:hypothetical protein